MLFLCRFILELFFNLSKKHLKFSKKRLDYKYVCNSRNRRIVVSQVDNQNSVRNGRSDNASRSADY